MSPDQQIHLDALITAFGDAGYDCGESDEGQAHYAAALAKYVAARATLRLYAIDPSKRPTEPEIALEIERNTGIKPA